MLLELNDPPPLLYVRGHMPDKSCKSVALVGAEDATHPGIELTVKLAGLFARAGVQVVSSISKGIDAAAHIGARASNGVSYGVLDSGLDHIHPSEHVPLAIDIAQSGGVISEYPPEQSYTDGNVASSNRLVAGLAQAVVVTEMYRTSERSHDLLRFCRQIGKLAFLMVDSTQGALADNESVAEAVACGAIPMTGLEKVQDIIRVLV
ncbi:MAG TPA: DNA-processing protein DprA [Candidatus Deferrimicrobium sp.]|nr:DNA-processing protein DprA [Candidatus Deferrimicrobium sp.]